MLIEFCKVTSCSKVELCSLLGHVNFASKVIIPGRSFMSYLLYLTRDISNNSDRITLNDDCRCDMQMWIDFLDSWNCVSFLLTVPYLIWIFNYIQTLPPRKDFVVI